MATLKELLEGGDLGAGQAKVASVQAGGTDMDGMDLLAMQLGLFGETAKVAESEEKEEAEDEKGESAPTEKKASAFSGLHSLLFPDSVIGDSAEKTASEKEASAERAMGAAAYDQFSSAFDSFVTKLAAEALAGNPHGDSQPVNHLPNNKASDAKDAIDTAPVVTDEVKAKNDAKAVGHYEQTKAASAFRKQMLLSALEG